MFHILHMGTDSEHGDYFHVYLEKGWNYHVFLYTKTPAYFFVNGEKLIAPAGSIIIYDINATYHYGIYGDVYRDDWIQFEYDEEILRELNIPMNQPFPVSDELEIPKYFQLISNSFFSTSPHSSHAASYLLHAMLCTIADFYNKENTGSAHYKELLELRQKIYSHPEIPWNITTTAKELGLSASYFQNQYHQNFGCTFGQDMIQSRLLHAKELLTNTQLSAKEISALCGYNNAVHFCRQFKDFIKVSPIEYRKKYQQQKNTTD